MNKHKIAWIALAAGIVFVIMLTWLVGVSPQISHIKSSDAQTAQIDENNKETRDEIETLRIRQRNDRPAERPFAPVAAADSRRL